MPITPAALKLRRKSCTFAYAGESVTVEYLPALLTPDTAKELNAWIAQANAATEDDPAAQQAILRDFGAWYCGLIVGWDFLCEDGVTPQPLTPENIAAQIIAFPDFLIEVVVAVVRDRTQGNASGTPSSVNSDATSSATAPSASTTESLNPSASSTSSAGSTEPSVSNG